VKLLRAAASCEDRKRERQVQSGAEVRKIGDGARNVVCLSLQVYHYRRHRCGQIMSLIAVHRQALSACA